MIHWKFAEVCSSAPDDFAGAPLVFSEFKKKKKVCDPFPSLALANDDGLGMISDGCVAQDKHRYRHRYILDQHMLQIYMDHSQQDIKIFCLYFQK